MTLREQYLGSNELGVDDGWADIIDGLLVLIDDEVKHSALPKFKVVQVKEKFGGLRFYMRGGNEVTQALGLFAERMSTRTCEICGDRGTLDTNDFWIKTHCPRHMREKRD